MLMVVVIAVMHLDVVIGAILVLGPSLPLKLFHGGSEEDW